MTTQVPPEYPVEEAEAPEPNHAGRAALAVVALLLAALGFLVYGPRTAPDFLSGVALVFVIPFSIGGLTATAIDPLGRSNLKGCLGIPTLILLGATALAWLAMGEGAICIAMILVPWIPAAAGGAAINRWLRWRRRRDARDDGRADDGSRLRIAAWTALPVLALTADATLPMAWRDHAVTREVILPAAPDEVWPLVLTIPRIAAEEGRRTFTHDVLGVPRPSEAALVRKGGELVRKARWGDDIRFDERVTEVRPGRRVGWTFAFPDDSVQRHTDRHISPDGPSLRILSGRYDLSPVGSRCTRLRLTTAYASRTRFDGYFSAWGERLLGDVQTNVLAIIAGRVGTDARECG